MPPTCLPGEGCEDESTFDAPSFPTLDTESHRGSMLGVAVIKEAAAQGTQPRIPRLPQRLTSKPR